MLLEWRTAGRGKSTDATASGEDGFTVDARLDNVLIDGLDALDARDLVDITVDNWVHFLHFLSQ